MNIKNLKISFAALFAGLALASCDKFLDEPRPLTTVPIEGLGEGTAGMDAALTGGWALWFNPTGMGGNIYVYPEVLGDYVVATSALTGRLLRTHQRDLQVEGYDLIGEMTQWSSRAQNMAAFVVNSARTNPPTDLAWATNGRRVLGEGLFLRSWIHFEYLRMMADQWDPHNPAANATALGPLAHFRPIINVQDVAMARTPLAAMYDSLITSLKRAEELLPEYHDPNIHDQTFKVRANRYAASALLARVYWQQNDFDNVLVQVNKVLGPTPGASNFPLATNFDDLYRRVGVTGTTNSSTKGEVILEYVAVAPTKLSTAGGQVIDNMWSRAGQTRAYFSTTFLNLAKFDVARDRRYRDLTADFTQGAFRGRATRKFTPNINIPLIRSAELLLMRAEVNARKGQLTPALADLNLVRRRAGLDNFATTDQNVLVQEIITERIRELHAEGYRSHELKRLGALTRGAVKFMPGDRNAADCGPGGCVPIEWNDRRLIWLIPNGELQVNPLAQNP